MYRHHKANKVAISRVPRSQRRQYASRLLCAMWINVSVDRTQAQGITTISNACWQLQPQTAIPADWRYNCAPPAFHAEGPASYPSRLQTLNLIASRAYPSSV